MLIKLIPFAFCMLVNTVIMAQNKTGSTGIKDTIGETKISPIVQLPHNQAPKMIICAPSKSALIQPLFVLDGKIIDQIQFNKINPNDIESIKVLKANEAKLIYGERGENGAITIISKK